MKYTVIGEILGLLFVAIFAYLFLNNEKMELMDVVKIIGILYVPQRICLFLQCKMMIENIRKMEDEKSG